MRVCVIGAGIIGLAIARDLALRGVECCLIERNEPGAETTTHCAGQLHSGARYVHESAALAQECLVANTEMRALASFALGDKDGIFVCLEEDSDEISERFLLRCQAANIPLRQLDASDACDYEPGLSPEISRAFLVPDRVMDPFLLVESHIEDVVRLGVDVRPYSSIVAAEYRRERWQLQVVDRSTGITAILLTDAIVIAAGPWSAAVASICGISLKLHFVHGSMAVLGEKLVGTVVSRCTPPSVGDVVIPAGNATLIGSTWHPSPYYNSQQADDTDIAELRESSSLLVPRVAREVILGTYTGVRTHASQAADALLQTSTLAREYSIIDHEQQDGIHGVVTALGGKLTLYRSVAEYACDAVLAQFGSALQCRTKEIPLQAPRFPSGRTLAEAWKR